MMGTFGIWKRKKDAEGLKLPIKKPACSGGNHLTRWFVDAPEVRAERNWRIFAVDALGRSVEKMKTMRGHACDDFSIYAAPGPRFPHAEKPGRSRDGRQYGIDVQRFYRPKIDNFNFDIFTLQLFGGSQ